MPQTTERVVADLLAADTDERLAAEAIVDGVGVDMAAFTDDQLRSLQLQGPLIDAARAELYLRRRRWRVEAHREHAKRYTITGPLTLTIDADEQDPAMTDALAARIAETLTTHLEPVVMLRCEDPQEECDLYWYGVPVAPGMPLACPSCTTPRVAVIAAT